MMASRNSIGVLLLGIGAVVSVMGAMYWWIGPDRKSFYTDDGAIRSTMDEASPRDVMWRPAEALRGGVNSGQDEADPEVGAGGDKVYLTRIGPGGDADLYVALREGAAWGEARALPINTPDNELSPAISPDGAWLYFASDRPGSAGGFDLWRAPVGDGRVGDAESLGTDVNSVHDDLAPALAPGNNGPVLYFSSDRPLAGSAIDEAAEQTGFDLFARPPGGGVTRLAATSSPADDLAPVVSPAGDFLYFSSDRGGGAGGFDLYRARLTPEGPGQPVPLGPEINTTADELEPELAMEGFALYFASDRGSDGNATGGTDLYRAISREVYLSREARGVLGELLALLPWILAALALVLLLALLTRTVRDVAWRGRLATLGLMARCVLLSLLVHGALMAVLTAMHVPPTTMAGAAKDGPVRVSLASSGMRASVASQMRGSPAPVKITSAQISPTEASTRAVETPPMSPASLAPATAPAQTERISVPAVTAVDSPSPAHNEPAIEPPTELADTSAHIAESLSTPRAPTAQRHTEQSSTFAPAPASVSAPSGTSVRSSFTGSRAVRFDPSEAGTRASADQIEPAEVGTFAAEAERSSPVAEGLPAETPPLDAALLGSPLEFVAAPSGSPAESHGPETALDVASAVRAASGALDSLSPELPAQAASGLITISPDQSGSRLTADAIEPGANLGGAFDGTEARHDASLDLPSFAADSPIAHVPPGTGDAPEQTTAEPAAPAVAVEPGEFRGPPSPPIETGLPSSFNAAVDLDVRPADRTPESDPFEIPITPDDAMVGAPAESPSTQLPDLDPLGGLAFAIPVKTPTPMITGRVIDAETGDAIDNAVVRLDHETQADIEVNATTDGEFVIEFGDIPDHAALAAAHPGYSPGAVNIERSEIERGEHVVIELSPIDPNIIAFEKTPEVHHLGNDEYAGRINSQFQREAEGTRMQLPFTIPIDRFAEGVPGAEIRLMTKGSQLENRVLLNGRRIGVLTESPRDGSFGEQAIPVPTRLLLPGENVLELRSVRRSDTDIDDFEFVNVRLALEPAGPPPALRISGTVVDDTTGEPVRGASVQLDRVEGEPLRAASGATGRFSIGIDDLPEFAAIVATSEGYEPLAVGISRAEIERAERLELRLTPAGRLTIAIENVPAVHHVGDDAFAGRVNSRFQRRSEGLELTMSFNMEQAPPQAARSAELRLLAKGLETNPPVVINGLEIGRLEHSPQDGRFAEQTIMIPPGALRAGRNTIVFRSVRERADHDDYEFINARLVLVAGARVVY